MKTAIDRFVLTSFFLSLVFISNGQRNCESLIDTFKIVTNQSVDGFLYKLQFDKFESHKEKSQIPNFIRETLDCLTGGDFSLTNPSEEYACCCTNAPKLPKRKLVYLCKSKNMFAISYWTGGVGEELHLVLISFIDALIIDIWAGSSFDDLISREKIINFLKKERTKKFNLFGFL